MIFGSQECFDYIYNKIKDDDYILDFFYEITKSRVVIKVTNRRFPEVVSHTFIRKDLWEDKFALAMVLSRFKTDYKKAFKSLKEATNNLQV